MSQRLFLLRQCELTSTVNKMKYKALLSTYYYPPEIGGIENYLEDVLRVSPKDFIVSTAYVECKPRIKVREEVGDINHYSGFKSLIKKNKRYFKWLLPLIYVNQFFAGLSVLYSRRKEINVIYAGSADFMVAPLILSKLYKLPLVTFVYGNDIKPKKSFMSQMYKGKILPYMLSKSKVIVAISSYTASILRDGGYSSDNLTLLNPFLSDDLVEKVRPREIADCERGVFVLLTVGRIVRRKGYEYVLKALGVIKKKGFDFKYRIVGDGPYRGEVEELIHKLDLHDNVELVGVVGTPAEFYQSADVFIMPSVELPGDVEGFGIVFLEAGLHGLPVIASNSGGIPDAVTNGETGILVNPYDIDQLADSIVLLMEDKSLCVRMGEAGYQRASERKSIISGLEEIEARIGNMSEIQSS